jgi:hypothetical protein
MVPKKENENVGYFYDVSDDEIKAHQQRSVIDIFMWIESTNRFVHSIQTGMEKQRSQVAKTLHA